MMQKLFNQKGFSLIEVIVSIAILFIIIASFSLLFSDSFRGIFYSGYKSEAQYVLQDAAENEFSRTEKDDAAVSRTAYDVSGFTINFEGVGTIALDGDEVLLETTFQDARGDDQTIDVTAFIPDGSE
jgi:prepilin-type N-terminal cleavage/methylation domain-containing protein